MGLIEQDWQDIKVYFNTNFDIVMPDVLNDVIVDGVANIAQAKPILVNDTRILGLFMLERALIRLKRREENLITNRIATAKSGYEADNPEFDPNTWLEYSNTEMFAMIQPYDPEMGLPETIEEKFNYVYGILRSKVMSGREKIDNLFELIIDVEANF